MPAVLPAIEPMPPRRGGSVPWIGAGAALLLNPTRFFADERRRSGDTFALDAFGFRLFCVFSPQGVRRLYELPEKEASFGLATFNLVFRHKAPLELVAGRRHRPHDLFGGQEVEGYLAQLERATGGASRRSPSRGASGTGSASAAGRARRQRLRPTSIG